jgi:hypothetical protein
MEAASTSEASVNYQTTRRNIPLDSHLQIMLKNATYFIVRLWPPIICFDRGLISGRGMDLIFSTTSRQALEPAQPPSYPVCSADSPGANISHLVPRPMSEILPLTDT